MVEKSQFEEVSVAHQLFLSGRPVPLACCGMHTQMFEKTHSFLVVLWLALPGHLGPQGLAEARRFGYISPTHICKHQWSRLRHVSPLEGNCCLEQILLKLTGVNATAYRYLFDRFIAESKYRCSYWWMAFCGSLTIAKLMTSVLPSALWALLSPKARLWVCLQRYKTGKVLCVCANWCLMVLIAGNTL